MASVRAYFVIYVLLIALAVSKVIYFDLVDVFAFWGYQQAIGATLASAVVKTSLIAGYYQHLRHEPRSLTYLMLVGLFMVLLLSGAATFSLT